MKIFCMLSALTLTACSTPSAPPSPAVGMANPAALYCLSLGGKSLRVSTSAGERSDCLLPDGKRIDEWTLYRAHHQ